jgi:hypothetical protein
VEYFGDSEFDAADYCKNFYEKNSADGAAQCCDQLLALKRETEEVSNRSRVFECSLRQGVTKLRCSCYVTGGGAL